MWFFKTDVFTGRAECGVGWESWLIFCAVFTQFLIFSAYMSIPLILVHFQHKYGNYIEVTGIIPKWTFKAFALFIVLCGIGHFWGILVFRWPMYYFYIFWDLLTGVASWVTVIGLLLIGPKLLTNWKRVQIEKEELIELCHELLKNQEDLKQQFSDQTIKALEKGQGDDSRSKS